MGIIQKWESALASGAKTLLETGNPFQAIKSLAHGWTEGNTSWEDFVDEFGIDDDGLEKILAFGASIVLDPIMWIPFTPVANFGVRTTGEVLKGGYNVMKKVMPIDKIVATPHGKALSQPSLALIKFVDNLSPTRFLEERLGTNVYDTIREGIILEQKAKMEFETDFFNFLSPREKFIRKDVAYPIISDRANYVVNKGLLNQQERELAEYIYKSYDVDAARIGLPETPDEILKLAEQHPIFAKALERMKKARKPLPKFIKDYMPKYYKDLKATRFSGNLTPRELLRTPGPIISMPVSFHPSFMKLRFVKDPDGETLIQDPILGFLKYKSDLFRKEFREPTYFLAREQIISLRKIATELENKGEAHRAELLRNKAELLARELLNIQGKTPRDKVVEGLSRGIAKTIYAATLAAPGSVLKNLGQIMFSWGVIGNYIFKGLRQMFTPEGKELLKKVPHVYSDWRPEFIDIYKFAARERVGLNKINDVVKNAALYPDDLGSFEKELMEKIYGFREKSIGSTISRIQDIALIPFSWAEGWLRGTTYLGARQRFLDFHKAGKVDELWKEVRRPYLPEIKRTLGAGKVEEAASKYADDIVGIAQFRYGTLDTPNLLKTPGGRLLLQFTSFPLNTVNMIHYFMEHNMHENVAKLIGLGAYNLYVGAKLGINAKEFSLYGAIPYGAAPVPSMIFYLHHSYLYPDVVDNIYALNRLAYLSFPGGRFLRKVKYATESLLDYRNTGVLAIRDDTYKMSREISFPELVAYLFDLPTINQTKIRSDFKAVRRAKAEYLKLKRRAEIAYSRKDYEELERIKETTGFQLTDEQIANLEWAYNVEVFDRVLKRFPKQGRFLLGEKLEVSPDEMDEMLRRIELYKGGKM